MASMNACSAETTNFNRLACAILDVCCDILRPVLKANLTKDLSDILKIQKGDFLGKLMNHQKRIVYPPTGEFSLEDADTTLLCALIRHIHDIKIQPPSSGWHAPPHTSDRSLAANIVRIKLLRDGLYGHLLSASLSDDLFNKTWKDMYQCVSEIERDELKGDKYVKKLDDIRTRSMDPETAKLYLETLQRQCEDDLEIKKSMKKMEGGVKVVAQKQVEIAADMKDLKGHVKDMAQKLKSLKETDDPPITNYAGASNSAHPLAVSVTALERTQGDQPCDASGWQFYLDCLAKDVTDNILEMSVYLRLEPGEVNSIKNRFLRNPHERCFNILWSWYEKNPDNETKIIQINNALEQSGRVDLAKKLMERKAPRREDFKYPDKINNPTQKVDKSEAREVGKQLTQNFQSLARYFGLDEIIIQNISVDNSEDIQEQSCNVITSCIQGCKIRDRQHLCDGLTYLQKYTTIVKLSEMWRI